MKNTYLIILLSLSISVLFGQNIAFEQTYPLPPFPQNIVDYEGVGYSSIAYADVDNDNDLDILISGLTNMSQRKTSLYINSNSGDFAIDTTTIFEGVYKGSIGFADIDNDNDQDVLITGKNQFNQASAKLYKNNGNGNYTLVLGTPFVGSINSSIAFADIDNDNDQDVVISGTNNNGSIHTTNLYINNGVGSFSLVSGTPFDGVSDGSLAFVDVNNDNDMDLIVSGFNGSANVTKLYSNNGNGGFTLVNNTPFIDVSYSSIAFADIDNDNDQDLLIAGLNSTNQRSVKLYKNNGNGSFTSVINLPFIAVRSGSVAFADIDNDNDQDILISGDYATNTVSAKLYTNNGYGIYTLKTNSSFEATKFGDIAFLDIDNDSDNDLIITGLNNGYIRIADLYINNGNGDFNVVTNSIFVGVEASDIAFADIDNDGDEDVLITGRDRLSNSISKLYLNDSLGNYTLDSSATFDGVNSSSIAFADFDNDNDLDVLITGYNNSSQIIAKLYSNNGSGSFTLVTGTPFIGVTSGSLDVGDIDNDGDQDILITGIDPNTQASAILYKNNGSGSFTIVTGTPFDGVIMSDIAFANIDNDNDLDVLITGRNSLNQPITKLYTNNGNGVFSVVNGTPFDSVAQSSVTFADIDNDGDEDVLITGHNNTTTVAKIYTNNGFGVFSLLSGTPFNGVVNGSATFTDIDNDSDLDLLLTGYSYIVNKSLANLYVNNGSGTFTLVSGLPFVPIQDGSVAFANVDGDIDQDVLISGEHSINRYSTYLYRNIGCNTYITDTHVVCGPYTWIDGVNYTSSNNTAIYSLNNIAGCDSIISLDLTITNFVSSTDTQTACNSYTWTNGITYTTSNNTAIDTILNAAGCDSVITLNLTINIADVSTTTTDPSITANAIGASYQWLDCGSNYAIIPSETAQLFTATANGNYAVEVTENGCTDTSACVTISTVSLDEISLFQDITIYPNPSNGMVNIELGKLKNVTIKVLNSNGQMVYKKENINTKNYQFELKEAAGVYFIELSSGADKREFKLVIK